MKSVRFMAVLLVLLCMTSNALAAQFSIDPKAIDKAAKSVLMLEVYDANNDMIATGSGFVAFDNRTIVTNYHVIDGADWMIANSDDGYQYLVTKVLIADEAKDIAICEFMSPTDLVPLELNTTGELMRAETVVAIGNPLGVELGMTNTVSIGNISALYSDSIEKLVQFTAPISHGSSGGALFDDSGRVIGMTSGAFEAGQNMNLAVHISEVDSLYRSWDGSRMLIGEYLTEVSATPTPAPTIEPTSSPLLTNTPISGPTPVPEQYPVLQIGSSGDDVVKLQQALIDLGYLTGKADGVFGDKTAEAVRLFKKTNSDYVRFSKISSFNKVATSEMQDFLYNGNPNVCPSR